MFRRGMATHGKFEAFLVLLRLGIVLGLATGTYASSSFVLAAEGHPGLEAEATYSEAVIAYHQRKLKLSLQIIDGLLKQNPDYLAALELKSLGLKELGMEKERGPILKKILSIKPEAERGPIYFEVGLRLQKAKKFDDARRSFEASAERGFNVVPARLFAGMIAFNAADMAGAEANMREVYRRGSTEMQLAGAYYLGLVNFKRGSAALGAGYLLEARRLARKNPELQLARDLSKPIKQVLEPFGRSQWYLNLSVLGQYDSNILQLPTSADVQQGSSKSAPKSTILAGFGYLGAPLSEFQFVPSYRFNTNKNFGTGLDSYEYASNTLALAVNWRPLSRISGGLKGEVTHSFQHFEGSYRSFTAAGDIGGFVKWTQSENLQLQLDASVRPLANFAQSDFGGTGQGIRLTYRRDGATAFWNPTITYSRDLTGTQNAAYRATAGTVSFSNLVRLSGDHQLIPGFDYVKTDYLESVPVRNDRTFVLRMAYARPISAQWTTLGDFSYTSNQSNIAGTYTFNRWVAAIGVSYSR
jgi:tetratricopeptide (TPR) repeat protein